MEWRECGYVMRTPVYFSTFQVAPGEDLEANLFTDVLTNTFMLCQFQCAEQHFD